MRDSLRWGIGILVQLLEYLSAPYSPACKPVEIWRVLVSFYKSADHLVTCSLTGFSEDSKSVTFRSSSAITSLVTLSLPTPSLIGQSPKLHFEIRA